MSTQKANDNQNLKQAPERADYNKVLEKALAKPVSQVAPNFKKGAVTEDQVFKLIQILANKFEIDSSDVTIGVILLFLKGAASESAPITMTVDVGGRTISKRELVDACAFVTGNKYLRRIAEAMAVPIGQYAERNGLRGEIAQRVETRHKAETGEGLTAKELAWLSSFSQCIPDLNTLASERVVKLLAADYASRFEKDKKQGTKASQNTKNKQDKKNVNKTKQQGKGNAQAGEQRPNPKDKNQNKAQ